LYQLVAWLEACGIDTVAMESTGVYWIPIYDLLEAHGIVPYLVNGGHVRMVPGRKSDWNDAQWLQKLHAVGLLRASFRPDAEIVALRTLSRYRADLIPASLATRQPDAECTQGDEHPVERGGD
jgi:transposase